LARSHEEGLSSVKTEIVQIPSGDNGGVAIVRAEVQTKKGTFSGIGDASAGSVNRRIVPHIVRMAETRGISRAMRLAVNIGMVALDELGDEADETSGSDGGQSGGQPPPGGNNGAQNHAPQRNGYANGQGQNGHVPSNGHARPNGNGQSGSFVRMTEPQRRLVFRLVAEAGYDGEGIEQEICRRAGVASLNAVSKFKASQMIESMKGGGQSNGAGHA
jgi:hypothetical protein